MLSTAVVWTWVPSQLRNNVLTIVLLRLRLISVDDDDGVDGLKYVRFLFTALIELSCPVDGF
jgi:hypothetical protein